MSNVLGMTDHRYARAATNAERERATLIFEIGLRFGCPREALDAVFVGTPAEDFQKRMIDRFGG